MFWALRSFLMWAVGTCTKEMLSRGKYLFQQELLMWELPVPAQWGDTQSSRTEMWFGGGGGELNLLPAAILSVVIAGRSGVAIRTPSYLISGLRCLCHNLKEN